MISFKLMQKLVNTTTCRNFMKCNRLMSVVTTNHGIMNRSVITTTPSTKQQHRFMSSSTSSSINESELNLSVDQLTSTMAGGDYIKLLVADNPYLDVVQYTHRSRTFAVRDIDYNAEALAIGIVENGFIPGDVILSFLPDHLNETMILQFACSKAGLILYNLDPTIATDDTTKAKQALEAALTLTKANVLITPEAWNDVNYIRIVERVVPELRFFDFSTGMPFVTPHFPHLRFCIHTGFDQHDKWGWIPIRHMVVPSNNLDTYIDMKLIHNQTPLAGQFIFDKDGIPTGLGPTLTNAEVYETKHWSTYSNILDRKFHVVDGAGIIF